MIALASCLVLTILRFVVDIKGLFILPDCCLAHVCHRF